MKEVVFEEYGGGRLLQWTPVFYSEIGDVLHLVAPDGTTRVVYELDRPVDLQQPTVTRARWGEHVVLNRSSCGHFESLALDVEGYDAPESQSPLFVRLRSVPTDLYWHSAALTYNDVCGGYPHQRWRERMEISMFDLAGNESEPTLRVVRGSYACVTLGGATQKTTFFVLLLLLAACRRESYCTRAADLREFAIECDLTSAPIDVVECESLVTSSCSRNYEKLLDARMDCYDLAPYSCESIPEVNDCLNGLEPVSDSCQEVMLL